ncbi:TetR/AcrR family transcriptional regulator [Peribacillus butanolivorans]|uniref:TetR/AcrR family transcriptional regulator n=1 Tax=Peribacillus butanolivorans TaxID=421767 RepID=UPI00207D3EA6|nr:TetR/AcrR family transcriptional regulator [Peribacillus butanolivorans]MCO0599558.1 TetR/AcrR family transcriptional regulator [Peribacillus butanolivorans]
MKVQNIRKTSTRQAIVEEFIELLKHKKIEKVTIKDITEQANINRATFYAHFEDKFQLFDEMTKDSATEKLNKHTKDIYTWDKKQVENLFQAVFEYLQQVKDSCPYSYQNLFPLLRMKMLDALKIHLQLCFQLNEFNDIKEFNILLYSRILYDATELLVVEKTNLSQKKIIEEVSLLIFNK